MIPPAHPETLSEMGSNAGRIRRAFRQLRNSPCSWMLFRILLIMQAVPVIWNAIVPSGPDKLNQAQQLLGLGKTDFLSGHFWQPLSYSLIHGNWLHLLVNAASILLLGSKLEHIVSKTTFWLLSLFAALAGGLLFLPLTYHGGDLPPTLVGSSAICFAFLVLLTTLSPESKFLPVFLSGRSIGIAIILANLVLALLNPNLPTGPLAAYGKQLSENGFVDLFKISHACHLGGSLAGYFYGKWLLRPRVTLKSLQRARAKKEAMANDPTEKEPVT
ncbi:MAG: rhomboid family intramembrane serine protease [Verrucomicrobia bacterium]|nr:rhomboid family intramembrane serine protease [Verrucomicrobiota bacterium]